MTVLLTDSTAFIKHAARDYMSIKFKILLILEIKYKKKIWIFYDIKDASEKREQFFDQKQLPHFVIKQA